ncbi:hypothetical protein BH20CHL4_BH20CHL4_15360 [soil metagenome]
MVVVLAVWGRHELAGDAQARVGPQRVMPSTYDVRERARADHPGRATGQHHGVREPERSGDRRARRIVSAAATVRR